MKPLLLERIAIRWVDSGRLTIDRHGQIWRRCQSYSKRAERMAWGGYLRVTVGNSRRGEQITVMAHRLVWQLFFGDIPDDIQINHRNGIKSDNRPANLELATCRENILHAFHVLGTRSCEGTNHSQHRITEQDVISIRLLFADGIKLRQIGWLYGLTSAEVSRVARGKAWSHIPDHIQPARISFSR